MRKRIGLARLSLATLALALLGATMLATSAPGDTGQGDLGRVAADDVSVVEVLLEDRDALDALVATGVDLDHNVTTTADGIVAHAVVTAKEAEALKGKGFKLGKVVYSEDDAEARVAEREATIAEHVEALEALEVDALATDTVKIIRADYYTSLGNHYLSVEAKTSDGQSENFQLTVERDSGPGTDFGSGGTQNISRFVDAGVYLYHRGASNLGSNPRPDYIRVTSPNGGSDVAKVNDWLPLPDEDQGDAPYFKDFVTSYLTPTDLYERIEQLHAEFPTLTDIVELPYETNGYRRKAQAILEPPGMRLVVDTPSPAAGEYELAGASFGPDAPVAGLPGTIALGDDATGDVNDGCEPLVGFPAGTIALVDRGSCPFVQKAVNAQDAGAIAVIVANNVPGDPFNMGGSGPVTIPAVMVSQDDGAAIKAGLPATGTVFGAPSISNASRVVVDSLAWGHEGGNDISVQLLDPGTANQALDVGVVGDSIAVSLATDASGAVTSTAAEVVAALDADAGSLVDAYTYRGSSGDAVVNPTREIQLSDFLSAPDTVSREPWTVRALRIGKTRDGSKLGVLAYSQEHAREWVPPLVSVETAERLLRNYAHDGTTKQLLNNLDIFIIPSVNPDGGHYSFYDFASQRKNMTNHCPLTGPADPNGRNSWGVDNNRNYDEYSLFDGYSGASTSCTSGTFAGPSELSEPESANVDWIAGNYPNIKFSMNLHSSGNYFMWSPGSYLLPGRISAPRPTLAEESFFWGASSRILTAIKQHRGLSLTPARTGPISDVLYSAAGNSGDMLWYKHGIYAWNFEVGTSFQPDWEEAHEEAMEFSNGLVELMHVAYDFDKDHSRPESTVFATPGTEPGTVDVMFDTSEPAAVFYTLDGSRPTYESTLYAAAGIREGAETLTVPTGTTIHWFSVDSAGNVENNYDPSSNGRNFNKTTVG